MELATAGPVGEAYATGVISTGLSQIQSLSTLHYNLSR